jgi:hypothetical protein
MARPFTPTDLQLILLSTAAAREDRNVLPLKDCIADKTAAVAKAIALLIKRALIIEQPETNPVRAWRDDDSGRTGLAITDAGLALLDGAPVEVAGAADDAASTSVSSAPAPPPAPRPASKITAVLTLLRRPAGATSAALIEATGWLPHTMRAALTGLRKKGHIIERSRHDEATCYRIMAQG